MSDVRFVRLKHHFASCLLAALATLFLGLEMARADSPGVTAVLNTSEAAVGEMVQMNVKISGASNVEAPETIAVDGLEIHRTGTSRQIEMHNFTTTSSLTYTYTVLPLKAGTFKIPPQSIRAGGAALHTPELTLHVAAGQSRSTAPNNGSSSGEPVNAAKLVSAELIVPKKTAYVGEMIPVVVRLIINARLAGLEPPAITGQGFTMQKLQGAEQPQVEVINGRQSEVYTFKTAISAVRPGRLEIGPIKANARIVVPRARPKTRSRSPFDIFDMDDPFSNPSLFDPFSRTGERRDVTITSEPVVLEVKPLPPNPPANFDGAVGTFTMNVEANPKSVQTGDPITVTATITGRGNFDRLNAPALEDEHGWHTYPSNGKFKQDDDVGISGVKTFETVVSPNERKTALPPLLFSYFDAAKEKYVTLRSEPVPIRVEGAAIATASAPPPASKPSAASSAAASAAPSPPQPAAKPADILYQVNERPARLQSFRPLYLQPAFWAAQIPPLLGLIGFVAIKLRQRRRGDERAARTAAWQREVSELMRRLRQSRESASQYFADASRAVQLKAALARGLDPNSVDLDTAAAAFNLDEPARTQLRQLFERRDEMRYSGGSANGELSDDKRRGILYFIENLKT